MNERFLNDEALIERAQKGDRTALNTLIRKHEARAYQYAFRVTRNPDDAADIVAEAFVRVYHALPNFKSQSTFTTWLYRILTNCFLDLRKKQKSRPTTSLDSTLQTDEGEVTRQIEDVTANPLEDVAVDERKEKLEEAIGLLPEYQRAMIIMYHAENMSYEEISAALDLPIGTVKSRLNRARISLRELLARDEELFRI